ncbi:MAG TPA: M23 family metallopeptidase [Bacteroidales bacterium]|nr:M23 family metallopeptidase [Bacteroidales bacterium]
MKKRFIILLTVCATGLFLNAQQTEKNLFISPLKETPSLSASFAELRADHFHTGLDYKTGGVTGKEVSAVADGYIYRISISPSGFGKAIYIRHPSGYSTVYGHLDHFRPDIEEYTEEHQYEKKNYTITLYPNRDQFQVKQGELIAWSGNSGGSSGPHLHFEIRDSSTEDPVNPLNFNLGVYDKTRPVIDRVVLYPLTAGSSVNSSHNSISLKTTGQGGRYTILSQSPLTVNGEIGIGIKTWDSFDNSTNRCGVYTIDLFSDSEKIFGFTAKRFSYSESRYINSHIDFRARMRENEYIHKAFLQPGNRLSMYNGVIKRGIISFNDDKEHRIIMNVTDASGNKSTLSFSVRSLSSPPVTPAAIKCSKILPWGKASDFSADGIRIHFPSLALYDTLFFNYGVRSGNGRFLSPVHSVHDETVAVHEIIRISIRSDTVIYGQEAKMCLVKINRDGKSSYAGGDLRYGFVSSEVRELGDYAVTIDTTAPKIIPSFTRGTDLRGSKSLSVTITDDFSGIRSYETIIDGSWALMEYDAKNNLLIYRFDDTRIKENSLHRMELKVNDNRGNTTTLKTDFTW